MSDCHNFGPVTGDADRVGGVIGNINTYCVITNCSNSGSVTSYGEGCGGIVGQAASSDSDKATNSTVKYCYNSGNINGTTSVGGITGNLGGSSGLGTVTNCYSKGKVEGTSGVGSVIGSQTNTTGLNTLNNLYYLSSLNLGAINGSDDAENKIEGVDDDLTSYNQFITWIESPE